MSSKVLSQLFALFAFVAVLAAPSSAHADDFVPFKVKFEATFGPPDGVAHATSVLGGRSDRRQRHSPRHLHGPLSPPRQL